MASHDERLAANRRSWDARTPYHVRSPMYDVSGFLGGRSSLSDLERTLVGDVRDKRLLHLQCHFGLDTLSWARLGATVTGLDFSEPAIAQARSLAIETGLADRARFVCANVFDAPRALEGQTFDVVFTSLGALCWLPDMTAWAEVVAACLRPGGMFHMLEFHPVIDMLDERYEQLAFPYQTDEPLVFDEPGTYADRSAPIAGRTYEWNHGLGQVVSALLAAGLSLERLVEHDFAPCNPFPGMVEVAPGRFRFARFGAKLPLVYEVSARKPAG